jgi:DNA mismatch repair ATPase MutS
MCGFPLIHLDKHLKVLVQQHKRFVAMCEEFPLKQDFGAKEFERRVTRIITPGTLIDEPFLNAYENNFLLAISAPPPSEEIQKEVLNIGVAWIDVSTGEFYSKTASLESIQDEVARINPREVVLPDAYMGTKRDHPLMDALAEENCFLSFATKSLDTPAREQPEALPLPPTNTVSTKSHQIPLTTAEQAAVDLLTSYLNANLLENMPPLTEPVQDNTGRMQIDAHTIKALEIRETGYEGRTRGSLFSVIKRTVTNGGTRLLSRWLCTLLLSAINCSRTLIFSTQVRPVHLYQKSQLDNLSWSSLPTDHTWQPI